MKAFKHIVSIVGGTLIGAVLGVAIMAAVLQPSTARADWPGAMPRVDLYSGLIVDGDFGTAAILLEVARTDPEINDGQWKELEYAVQRKLGSAEETVGAVSVEK